MELFDNMGTLLTIFWFIAIPTSIVFIIQTIMTFIGTDASDGLSADFDSNLETTDTPFQVFSLRNLINFLLGFSWTGISFYNTIANASLLILLSTVIGVLFVLFFFIIIKQIQRFAEDNSFTYSKTINKTGEVYLTIPENRSGYGKVLISVNGSVHELEAMTEHDKIESGKLIKVVKIESDKILIVEKI